MVAAPEFKLTLADIRYKGPYTLNDFADMAEYLDLSEEFAEDVRAFWKEHPDDA